MKEKKYMVIKEIPNLKSKMIFEEDIRPKKKELYK